MRWRKPSASTVFAILMVLSFLGLFLPPGCLNSFRSGINSLLAPPAVSVNYLLRYFAAQQPLPPSFNSKQLAELYNHFQQIQRQNVFLHMQWQQMVDKYAQAEHLRKNLLLKNYSLIPVNVCSYGSPGRAVLSIDQGSAIGLEKGFWVVGFPEGGSNASGWERLAGAVLVGRIAELEAHTAQVRLLGDPDDYDQPKILAYLCRRSPGGDPQALTKGPILNVEPIAGGLLIARDVPGDSDGHSSEASGKMIGASVVSAAMGNVPVGLALGRVIKVRRSPRNVAFFDLIIEPVARADPLYSVMVLRPIWPSN